MKVLILTALLALTACNEPVVMNDITIGTDGIENTWDKAVSDTRNEYDRTENRVDETLVKANADAVDEEHDVTGRTKDTLAKANSDVLDEEASTTGRVKDTLAKANSDAVDEEHRFNDRFKTTTKKANMDTIAEGDKLTDRLVGSDDKTIDQHGDDIRDLQRRMALVEQVNESQSTVLNLHHLRLSQLETRTTETEKALADTKDQFFAEVSRLDAKDEALQADLEAAIASLSDSINGESAARASADAQIVSDLLAEISARQSADSGLQTQITSLSGSLSSLTSNYNSFKTLQLLNNTFQQGQLIAAGLALANLSSRMNTAESDINSLETAVAAIQTAVSVINGQLVTNASSISSLQSSVSSLTTLTTTLQTAVNASCTISRSTGTVETYEMCDSVNWGGHCTDWDEYTLRNATLTLQCLGQPAQTLPNVLFRN